MNRPESWRKWPVCPYPFYNRKYERAKDAFFRQLVYNVKCHNPNFIEDRPMGLHFTNHTKHAPWRPLRAMTTGNTIRLANTGFDQLAKKDDVYLVIKVPSSLLANGANYIDEDTACPVNKFVANLRTGKASLLCDDRKCRVVWLGDTEVSDSEIVYT